MYEAKHCKSMTPLLYIIHIATSYMNENINYRQTL